MLSRLRSALALAPTFVLLLCPIACEVTHPEGDVEAVASLQQAMRNGMEVTQGEAVMGTAGGVVWLREVTSKEECSGVLVTPTWVLTANHCVPTVEGSVVVIGHGRELPASDDYDADDAGYLTTHTPELHGESHRIKRRQVAADPGVDTATNDLALIPLDSRVPLSVATPLLLPSGRCADSFQGKQWGYGQQDFLDDATYGQDPIKRHATFQHDRVEGTWVGEAFEYDAVTKDSDGYIAQKSDSGGPVMDTASPNTVCGIFSHVTEFQGCTADCTISTVYSDISREAIRDWLDAHLLDERGELTGTCNSGPQNLRDIDTDLDRIPDACDPEPDVPNDPKTLEEFPGDDDEDGIPNAWDKCPTVFSPRALDGEGFLTQLDTDNDGIGDECDWCVGASITDQMAANCNYEAELAASYPGRTAPPVTKSAEETQLYQDTFRIAQCDTAPCPAFELLPNGSLPDHGPASDPFLSDLVSKLCVAKPANRIRSRPQPPGLWPDSSQRVGTTAHKWCQCLDQRTDTLAGRVACQAPAAGGCLALAAAFDTNPNWIDITGTDGEDSSWEETPLYPLSYQLDFETLQERTFLWDYLSLGEIYYDDDDRFFNPSVSGVLWSSLRSYGAGPPITDPQNGVLNRAQFTADGSGRYRSECQDIDTFTFDQDSTTYPMPCLHCPDDDVQIFIVPRHEDPFPEELLSPLLDGDGTREILTNPEGVWDAFGDADTGRLFGDPLLGGVIQLVAPAEHVGRLQSDDPSRPALAGITYDTTNGEIRQILQFEPGGKLTSRAASTTRFSIDAPCSASATGATLSATASLDMHDGVRILFDGSPADVANYGTGPTILGVEAQVGSVVAGGALTFRNRATSRLGQATGGVTRAVDAQVSSFEQFVDLPPSCRAASWDV